MSTIATTNERDDAVEYFADSLESLYDHHMPAHGDPLELYTYTPPPAAKGAASFTVRLPPQQVNSLFAHHVWNAGLRMADAIAEGRLDVREQTVVELGAGAGLPALMAARAGARRVVITDYDDPLIVANMRDNIALALRDLPDVRARVAAEGHSWGEEASLSRVLAANDDSRFSLILLADTLWVSSAHDLLLSSLTRLFDRSASARIAVCAGFHSGRRTVRRFLRKAKRVGLVPRGPAWEELGVDGRRREWGWDRRAGSTRSRGGESAIADRTEEEEEKEDDTSDGEVEEEDASERNKWVVEGLLGWSDEALAGA
ncbi:hypothetical protein JCM10908_002117 [Rhodotorula pacifica]|uniref:uncharacterized protein n=1 Tax=Rhodotorula pacifica TaxID=1495444 RepID=UPI003175C25E